MRRLLLAAALLAGCASSKVDAPAPPAQGAVAPAPPPAAPAAVPVASPVPPAIAVPAPVPVAAPAAPAPAATPAPVTRPTIGHAGGAPTAAAPALLPPGDPGTSRSVLAGCLLAASEAEAGRFPPPPALRSAGPKVTLAPVAGGALVSHELEHACCLKGEVATRLEGRTAIVRERLLGTPCRCRCASTLRTAVALTPGRWTVAVEVEEAGAVRRVHEQPFDVR